MKRKTCLIPGIALAALASNAESATVTLTTADLINTSSFNSNLHWSDGQAPSAANDYVVNIERLRTPATAGDYVFAGNSLTLGTSAGKLSYKTVGSHIITINNLILDGGIVDHLQGSAETFTLAGGITVNGTGSRISATQGPVVVSASLGGSGTLAFDGGGPTTFRTTFTGTSTLSGNITVNGVFTASETSTLTFTIGASGVNNSVGGAGTAAFNGTFALNLGGASTAPGSTWTLVNAATLNESFGETFNIPGFTKSGNIWVSGDNTYVFSQVTGQLSVVSEDSDSDGLTDLWELTHFGNLNQDGSGDPDNDYATNMEEQAASTSPADRNVYPDAEDGGFGDGMADAWEAVYFGNNSALPDDDADNDTFSNYEEFLANSDPTDPDWTPLQAALRHRWSFNGNLNDSVGGSNAQIIDPDNDGGTGGGSTLSSTDLLLAGGARASSAYALLGTNLLQGLKTPVTLEFWATQQSVQNWSRIFDFGSGNTEYLFMSWTQAGNAASDQVEWIDSGTISNSPNTNQPYTAGTEFHIVMTIEPGAGTNSSTLVTWYSAPASSPDLGVSQGSFSTTNQLALLNDTFNYLGRSQWDGDNTANARYNEVRIWNGALIPDEREFLHDGGPQVVDASDSDGDFLADAWELENFRSTPEETEAAILAKYDGDDDPDGDLHDNFAEFSASTDPLEITSSPDSDGDGLADGWEVLHFGETGEDLFTITGKQNGTGDPDGDGYSNEAEETAGSDPNDPASNPADADSDGLIDSWEMFYFSDLDELPGGNPDGDSATNLQEQAAGSNPALAASTPADTDGDGTPDSAEAFQPYTVDSSTLHLWHLDETGAPAADAVAGGTPLASLQNGAQMWTPSLAGFGTGLNPSAGRGTANGGVLSALPLAADTTDDTVFAYAGADGAFTFEAIVRLDFDPAVAPASVAPMQIVTGENDADAARVWQFRIVPVGATGNTTGTGPLLEFINLQGSVGVQSLVAPLPMGAAANAAQQGGWYHVAAAYNGAENTADNLKFYWTKLDPANTQASQLASLQMTQDLLAATACDLTIGNEGRTNGGSTDAFAGVIDEVRISSVARNANQFLFIGEGDGDAMDDAWEIQYFGSTAETETGDFDQDGTDNLTEYRLGLIPNSGSSRFAATRNSSGLIQWPAAPGTSFSIYRSTTLAVGSWEDIGTVNATGSSASFTDPNPPAGKAFYRVELD